jgi:hypothetical protein
MPYVLRNAEGRIDSLHRTPVPGSELLAADHPEVAAFLGGEGSGEGGGFAALDASLIRVVEDLVDVLVARNILRVTDLPPEAQKKLFARKGLRERFRHTALQLYAEAPEAADPSPSPIGRFDTL